MPRTWLRFRAPNDPSHPGPLGSLLYILTSKQANTLFMNDHNQSPLMLLMMYSQILLTLCWRSVSEQGSDCIVYFFANTDGGNISYCKHRQRHHSMSLLIQLQIVDTLLTLILIYSLVGKFSHLTAQYSPIVFLSILFLVKLQNELSDNTMTHIAQLLLIPIFHLISIELIIINAVSTCIMDSHTGWINPGIFGAASTFCRRCVSQSSHPLSRSIYISLSPSQTSSLSCGLSKFPFNSSQLSMSEMLWGALLLSLLAGWWSIVLIWRTFNVQFVLRESPFQTKPAAEVIFLSIWIQPQRCVQWVTRMLSGTHLCVNWIQWLTFVCFGSNIPSV